MPRVEGGSEVFYLDGFDFFREERRFHEQEIKLLKEILALLKKKGSAISAKGVLMPATIPISGNRGAQFTFTEFDGPNGTGNKVAPLQAIVYASDNTAVATVDATGLVTALSAGSANISGTDPGNGLTASDVLTVTAITGVAVSATGVLSAL